MESCLSLLCDQVVNQFSQWLCLKVSYIHNISDNLVSLERTMVVLTAKRDDVQGRVNKEEFNRHQRRLAEVQVWLNNVLTIENQVSDLFSTSEVELQKLCFCSFCSKNLKQSYRYGKSVIMILREVESLSSQGEFDVVTESTPIVEVEELPIQPRVVGQEPLLEKVWIQLMEDEVGIVGLYGMGGVGKTTLLTQINNKFSEIMGRFDLVIWVVVSNGATIYKIQGDIASKIGIGGTEWAEKSEYQRAVDIHYVLKRRRFVLLLDDTWEKVNLEAVGVPYPSKENGCKIAFTTRSREVCGSMGVHAPIKVSCLDPDKAWDLFQNKVGVDTLGNHPDIPKLARKVAGKCCGLPLALNVIGETMASKSTVQEWCHTIDILTSSASEFSGMENNILPILKYSYDNLNGEQVKLCFLYCCLFPEDYEIDKKRLIEYWICEGFLDEIEGRDKALNQGYEIIGTLVRACLLLDEAMDRSTVSMHDVVRDMALWITSDLGKQKDQCIVQAGVRLSGVPKVKNWRVVKRVSMMNNEIEKIVNSPDCPQLTTLLLQNNKRLVNISGEFFRSMPKLVVLDLSKNRSLDQLPEEMSELISLRYLDLSYTNIKRLPLGLQELKMLLYLNLEYTKRLASFEGISNFPNLRTLRLQFSKMMLDLSFMKKLELLQHLEFVSINIWPSLFKDTFFYDSRVGRCIQEVCVREIPEELVRILVLPVIGNLRNIVLDCCGMWEIKIDKTSWKKNLTPPCFSNLSSVSVHECDNIKDLTWLLFAPNLTYLYIGSSKELVDIISEQKAMSFTDERRDQDIVLPFRKLEFLILSSLPKLKSIYWRSLPFQCLWKINVSHCPNLRKLPLNSQSVLKVEDFVMYHKDDEWKGKVEWEDEATRLRFLPSFKTQ